MSTPKNFFLLRVLILDGRIHPLHPIFGCFGEKIVEKYRQRGKVQIINQNAKKGAFLHRNQLGFIVGRIPPCRGDQLVH